MNNHFIQTTSSFLFCCIDSLPFDFFGVKVGASPRRESLWNYVVDKMINTLSTWKGIMLSMSGRVVMINAMLNSIQIYTLSF